MDPEMRMEAKETLAGLFKGVGQRAQGQRPEPVGGLELEGLLGQVQEFVSMPMDLAVLFLDMSVDLAELVLETLEQAGYILVKGATPL